MSFKCQLWQVPVPNPVYNTGTCISRTHLSFSPSRSLILPFVGPFLFWPIVGFESRPGYYLRGRKRDGIGNSSRRLASSRNAGIYIETSLPVMGHTARIEHDAEAGSRYVGCFEDVRARRTNITWSAARSLARLQGT
ncbi:hypothetical protein B0O99DRAFT_267435 [Bisporella sp. PMI_857]|nr:hypothetical protein B0O99DRAFT_267435 [Bisporella sp. PMI_857]